MSEPGNLGACDALAMNPDDVYDMTLVRESFSYVNHLLAWVACNIS